MGAKTIRAITNPIMTGRDVLRGSVLITGLDPPEATSADDWDMKINGGVAQLLPWERRAARNACGKFFTDLDESLIRK
jgi:hypothetical protein